MQRNGDEEREARRGVQGVSSSAWLEIMKVPVGKIPLWDLEDGGLGERRRWAKSRFLGLLFLFEWVLVRWTPSRRFDRLSSGEPAVVRRGSGIRMSSWRCLRTNGSN